MSARMIAAQARALLDGATPGPWMHCHTWDRSGPESWSVLGQDFKDIVRTVSTRQRGDTRLAAAAPDLAAHVAWLYGREVDEDGVWEGLLDVRVMDGRIAVCDHEGTTTYFNLDEAVNLARAVLSAVEEARK